MIKAFRDTWEIGVHSYLSYLRDRLLLAKELLAPSGSVFVQIADENLHHVRELCDEVFGAHCFQSVIAFVKTSGLRSASRLDATFDFLVWYCRDPSQVTFNPLWLEKSSASVERFDFIELKDGSRRRMSREELADLDKAAKVGRAFSIPDLTKPGPGAKYEFELFGQPYESGNRWWGTPRESMLRLAKSGRLMPVGQLARYVRYLSDFPLGALTNLWSDTGVSGFGDAKVYVVQTNQTVIERCLLMTTHPGDLVLDPTCGSGTTAVVAEKWGRRWITCDTSRVAITLAKQRLMTASYDYFELAYPHEGLKGGFIYKTVPHITLKSIANNAEPPRDPWRPVGLSQAVAV